MTDSKTQVLAQVETIIRRVQEITDAVNQSRDRVAVVHPDWNIVEDARLTGFTMLAAVLGSTKFALTFSNRYLLSDQWWSANLEDPNSMSEKDRGLAWYNFIQFTKVGLVQFVFAGVESTFRILLRSIDPLACHSGTAEFKSIYESLLKSKLAPTPLQGVELLDLFRLVRNTVHNNGVYFHKSGKDAEVTYKGTNYIFRIGQPVDFYGWDLILLLVEDIRQLLMQVVSDPIIALQSQIKNPATRNSYPEVGESEP